MPAWKPPCVENIFYLSSLITRSGYIIVWVFNRPNAKMAAWLIFYCLNLNKPDQPRSSVQNSKEYVIPSEASRANLI